MAEIPTFLSRWKQSTLPENPRAGLGSRHAELWSSVKEVDKCHDQAGCVGPSQCFPASFPSWRHLRFVQPRLKLQNWTGSRGQGSSWAVLHSTPARCASPRILLSCVAFSPLQSSSYCVDTQTFLCSVFWWCFRFVSMDYSVASLAPSLVSLTVALFYSKIRYAEYNPWSDSLRVANCIWPQGLQIHAPRCFL